jgi:hypothetical protein
MEIDNPNITVKFFSTGHKKCSRIFHDATNLSMSEGNLKGNKARDQQEDEESGMRA